MEVITRDTEEVRAYFEALEEGMRYLDTVTARFRPAMNGEVYLTGEDVQAAAHHAENVAGLPHATADPVHIAAGQDALPPVGSAAYAGGELRGHAPKAQTGEKSNINARGCASGNAAKAGTPHRKFLPLPHCPPGKGVKPVSRKGAAHPLPVLFPVLLLQHAPLHGGVYGDRRRKSELTILLVTSA